MKRYVILLFILIFAFTDTLKAQGGIPIYHDYLSDNLFLIHPSMAGASSCAKVRLTGRMQWLNIPDAPMLQTFSFHTHLGQSASNELGAIIFNDRNGYHAQKGLQLAYAHHINFGSGEYVDKLSFGIAASFIQNQLDETSFDPNRVDPLIAGIVQSTLYYNVDFGFSYHLKGFFLDATLKNALLAARNLYSSIEPLNLRNYVVSFGNYISGNNNFSLEPSVMLQYKTFSGQIISDFNMKFYFNLADDNSVYLGASYRKDWDNGDLYIYHNLTPVFGVNIDKFVFAYTYTYELGDFPISGSGFHQVTFGYNFNCKKQLVRMGCPAVF